MGWPNAVASSTGARRIGTQADQDRIDHGRIDQDRIDQDQVDWGQPVMEATLFRLFCVRLA
jgi:hypothetical protein